MKVNDWSSLTQSLILGLCIKHKTESFFRVILIQKIGLMHTKLTLSKIFLSNGITHVTIPSHSDTLSLYFQSCS